MTTVRELIAQLEDVDPELEVFVPGHPDGGGVDDADLNPDPFWVRRSVRCSYAGQYVPVAEGTEGAIKGVLIR